MDFNTDVSVQTTFGLLIIALCLALVIFGLLLLKFRFLDTKTIEISRATGVFLIIFGTIVFIAAVFGIIFINFSSG